MIIFFLFYVFVWGYGYIILVIINFLDYCYLYHRAGIYFILWCDIPFYLCSFGILMYVTILSLFYDHCFWDGCIYLSLKYDELWFKLCLLVGNVNLFIVKDNDYYLIVMVVNFFDINMICVTKGFSWPSFGWAFRWIWYSLSSDVGSWSIHPSIRYLIRDITVPGSISCLGFPINKKEIIPGMGITISIV